MPVNKPQVLQACGPHGVNLFQMVRYSSLEKAVADPACVGAKAGVWGRSRRAARVCARGVATPRYRTVMPASHSIRGGTTRID